MLDIIPESNFDPNVLKDSISNYTNTQPKSMGGSGSSIFVFEYQDPPGRCLNHTTMIPFFECVNSSTFHRRVTADKTKQGDLRGDEVSFFTSGISYEMDWDSHLSYTLLGINPLFFDKEIGCD